MLQGNLFSGTVCVCVLVFVQVNSAISADNLLIRKRRESLDNQQANFQRISGFILACVTILYKEIKVKTKKKHNEMK